jgi:hypothetical protein
MSVYGRRQEWFAAPEAAAKRLLVVALDAPDALSAARPSLSELDRADRVFGS